MTPEQLSRFKIYIVFPFYLSEASGVFGDVGLIKPKIQTVEVSVSPSRLKTFQIRLSLVATVLTILHYLFLLGLDLNQVRHMEEKESATYERQTSFLESKYQNTENT
ncbi:hypothetical protein SD80_030590 [Scytonema tolypothrichoides VB-61278]|nr:hypothetical protein SD80_030590 [Scytonema tolypothrichoides VB-61278]